MSLPNRNMLALEDSLYLQQHKNHPVHWQTWSDDILLTAQTYDRPILLSSGYASCHWCHVMAEECFADTHIASIMNAHFINIKIDREERPEIDTYYMAALQMLHQQAGWPLTLFLTPKGHAFWGGTYFPKKPRHGLPGFANILIKIADYYKQSHEHCEENAHILNDHIKHYFLPQEIDPSSKNREPYLYKAAIELYKCADLDNGGFGKWQKFPHLPALDFIDTVGWLSNNTQLSNFAHNSLIKMCSSGLFDHIGGGFFRYCTDKSWTIPHFEKMLYDNAFFVSALTHHAKKDPQLYPYLHKTIHFLCRDMQTPNGAFASSIDACNTHGEGQFYLWTEKEIRHILDPESYQALCAIYDIRHEENCDRAFHLYKKYPLVQETQQTSEKLTIIEEKLFHHRNLRPKPTCDKKILTDWNGLCIEALAHAGLLYQTPTWVEVAHKAFQHIFNNNTPNNTLKHSYTEQSTLHKPIWQEHVYASDYAYMIAAALSLAQHPNLTKQYLEIAEHLVRIIENDFFDSTRKSYNFVPSYSSRKDVIPPLFIFSDSPLPSIHAIMLKNYMRLYHFTTKETYYDKIQELKASSPPSIQSDILSHANLALSLLIEPYWHCLRLPSKMSHDLIDTAMKNGFKHFQLFYDDSPSKYKGIMLCDKKTCSMPLNSPQEVVDLLNVIKPSNHNF